MNIRKLGDAAQRLIEAQRKRDIAKREVKIAISDVKRIKREILSIQSELAKDNQRRIHQWTYQKPDSTN